MQTDEIENFFFDLVTKPRMAKADHKVDALYVFLVLCIFRKQKQIDKNEVKQAHTCVGISFAGD